tara:strand:- start:1786 stop:2178 length:393 start_codon:yes stop_codon:yes gene_type:complete
MSSINQPWAISDKFISKYGNIWAEMDFKFNEKLTNYKFKTDPMNTSVGTLEICGKSIPLTYKQLISYTTTVSELAKALYFEKDVSKHDKFVIPLGQKDFYLKKHELGKLNETLGDSLSCIAKSYQLGLYL